MAHKKIVLKGKSKLTPQQIRMLKDASKKPISYDEDIPPQTAEELAEFRSIMESNQSMRRKENVTIRLSQSTLNKARALGKGYTGVLGRLLDMALDDPEMIKRAL